MPTTLISLQILFVYLKKYINRHTQTFVLECENLNFGDFNLRMPKYKANEVNGGDLRRKLCLISHIFMANHRIGTVNSALISDQVEPQSQPNQR